MTPRSGLLRARVVVATYGPALVIGLGLLGLVSLGSAGWVYANPPTTEVTDRIDRMPVSSELHTRASVTGDSSLYSEGTVLRDQPVYFTSATPTIRLSLRTTITTDDPATVEQSLDLIVRGTHDGRTFWTETRPLDAGESNVTNGTVTTSSSIDVRRIQRRVNEVTEEIASAGSVDVLIRTNVTYETPRYSGHESKLTPVRLTARSYEIEPITFGKTHSTPVSRTITVPRQSRLGYEFPATVGVVAVLVSGLVGVAYRRQKDTESLEHSLHRERYDEWISTGDLPPDVVERTVSLGSLEDVVDVAIDMNKRVIHDEDRDRYAVIDGRVVYDYTVDDRGSDGGDDSLPTESE